ncbi:MAG: nucleotidyltransferase domain-containing protein [Candidatus Thermoplasmatota archaeon]|nr:nucleotidyltransferase domain-containing protein [Candidatus Thermoplasmatota archaeon]
MDKGDAGGWRLSKDLRCTLLTVISPSAKERSRINDVSGRLVERIRTVTREMGLSDIEPVIAGSVAKGTMGKDPDLDLFLIFPEDTPVNVLESVGSKIGLSILQDPCRRYTQHPYVTGWFEGVRCDLVPCVSMTKGSKVRTAVDRTPYHTSYINSRMTPRQKEDVLLLKSFLRGIGAYGAEDTVQGCSGYLAELLILKFDDLEGVIGFLSRIAPSVPAPGGCEEVDISGPSRREAAIVLFDKAPLADEIPLPAERYERMFGMDPLVVVDPVDARRNVASSISSQTLSYMGRAASKLMEGQNERFFHPFSGRPISAVSVRVTDRTSGGMLFELELPGGDPGIVITQLRRSLRKLTEGMFRMGFEDIRTRFLVQFPKDECPDPGYLRSRYIWDGDIPRARVIVHIKTEPKVLSRDLVHWGPPVDNPRMKDFNERWGDMVRMNMDIGRAYVVIQRDRTDPWDIANKIWDGITHGSSFTEPSIKRLEGDLVPDELSWVLSNGHDIWVD